ncbi:TIGR01212 family radical SAM protein [Candidatus Omnitrophota bacterium]
MKKNKDRYYKFATYLKERFGCRVHKAAIDAGFSCPNKDGKISNQGCVYCDNRAVSFVSPPDRKLFPNGTRLSAKPIESQIEEGITVGRKLFGAEKFIVYFQFHTNTYASADILKQRYDAIKKFPDIVGISIGTRPDCVNQEVLDLIHAYTVDYEVWIEYGLQSIHDKTLKLINRGHSYNDFSRAVEATRRKKDIKICAHVIIGLPGETKQHILQTAEELGRLKLDGIKIHPLHVIRGTKLEELLSAGLCKPLDFDEYVNLTVDFLEQLWPNTVVQRISADCPEDLLVSPLWILGKNKMLNAVENTLLEKNKYQGRLYK